MTQTETEAVVRQVLDTLQNGVPLDWTDVRVYLVVALAAGFGSVIGAWAQAFFSKRGEIAAIKKDLDQITEIQEEIKTRISGELWIDQNFWNLKRETYWKSTTALSQLSTALWELLSQGFSADKTTPTPTPEVIKLREKIESILDDVISLTAPSHIVLCAEGIRVLETFHGRCGELNKQLARGVAPYAFFDSLRKAADTAFNELIAVAKRDLREYDSSKQHKHV